MVLAVIPLVCVGDEVICESNTAQALENVVATTNCGTALWVDFMEKIDACTH